MAQQVIHRERKVRSIRTRLDTIRVQNLEFLSDGLHLLQGPTRDSPFQIGGMVFHNVLSAEVTSVAGWT